MILLRRSAYVQQARRFTRNARLFLASQALAGIGSGVFSLLFNLYLVRLGFGEDIIGQIAALSALSTGIAALPAGLIGDRLGRRRSLLIGGCLACLGYMGQTITPRADLIMGLAVIAGGGMALIVISMSPFMADNSGPEERPYLFSIAFALMTLCTMVGNLIGGLLPRAFAGAFALLPDDPQPYRLALWIAVGLFAVTLVPFYLLRDERREPQATSTAATAAVEGRGLRQAIAAFAIANVVIGMGGGLVIPFFNVFFMKQFGLPAEQVGVIFAVSQALMGMGQLLSPAAARRTGKMKLIVASHWSVIPFLAIMATTGNPWIAAAGLWGRNVGINMVSPIYSTFAMEIVPQRMRATLAGINQTAWNAAWAAGSVLGGRMILALGYPAVFVLSAGLYFVTGSIYAVAFRRHWREP